MTTMNKTKQRYTYRGKNYAYNTVHHWLQKKYGKANHCEDCGTREQRLYHWANISGLYKWNRNDWKQLCVPCHRKMDFTDEHREKISLNRRRIRRSICMYNTNGQLMQTFRTVLEASRETKVLRTAIYNNLSGLSENAGNRIWKYGGFN